MRKDAKKVIFSGKRKKLSNWTRQKTKFSYDEEKENDLGGRHGDKEQKFKRFSYNEGHNINRTFIDNFIRSRIGHHIDEVYKELCEVADARTYAGWVLRDWFKFSCNFEQHNFGLHEFRIYDDVYINADGIICKRKTRMGYKYKKPKPKLPILTMDGQDYIRHNGIWFRVWMVSKEDHGGKFYISDAFFGLMVAGTDTSEVRSTDRKLLEKTYGLTKDGQWRYVAHKEQANKKEIKKLTKMMEN